MTKRTSIATLVERFNTLAVIVGAKALSPKTSLKRSVIEERVAELQAQVDASTETVSLVSLCIAHNKNAKSIRQRFRDLYARADNTLPAPVVGWNFRAADVDTILPHVTR